MRTFRRATLLPVATVFLATAALGLAAAPAHAAPEHGGIGEITTPPIPLENPVRPQAGMRSKLGYSDKMLALRALHLALSQVPDGGTFVWHKKSRSLKGVIRPSKAFRNAEGEVCRHVIYALELGRIMKQVEGIACRQDDGRWQL